MANEKLDMSGFVREIRDKQGLDREPQGIDTQATTITNTISPATTKTGRPKKVRKIEGGAPVTVFFDQDTKSKLVLTKVSHRIEMKDLIFGATLMFLDKYYDNGELSAKGLQELEKTLKNFYGE